MKFLNDPMMCCLQETHFRSKDVIKSIVKGWRKIFDENSNIKRAGVATLILDKTNFKVKN